MAFWDWLFGGKEEPTAPSYSASLEEMMNNQYIQE